MTDWKKVRREYENTDITMKDLAKRYGVKTSTVRSRKNREKWQKQKRQAHVTKNATPRNKTQRKNVATLQAVNDIKSSGLNDKQRLFAMYYLQYFNATKAYREAYHTKYDVAKFSGYRLLHTPKIARLIKRIKQRQSTDLYLNANDVLREYAREAFADIGDFIEFGHKQDEDPNTGQPYQRSYLYFKNKPEVDTSMIDSIHIGQNGAEIKLPDKQKALKQLLDHVEAPTNESNEDNTFIKALRETQKKNKNNDNKDKNSD